MRTSSTLSWMCMKDCPSYRNKEKADLNPKSSTLSRLLLVLFLSARRWGLATSAGCTSNMQADMQSCTCAKIQLHTYQLSECFKSAPNEHALY